MLGRDGPQTSNPSKYIRFIYNRVVLENETIRAACPELCPRIMILLERCLLDEDDETRDRAAYYLRILREDSSQQKSAYILNPLQVSISSLERQLQNYIVKTEGEKPFDINNVQIEMPKPLEETVEKTETFKKKKDGANRLEKYLSAIRQLNELSMFGPIFKSSMTLQVL